MALPSAPPPIKSSTSSAEPSISATKRSAPSASGISATPIDSKCPLSAGVTIPPSQGPQPIALTTQALPRRCELNSQACLVDGRRPADIFLETDADGNAAWLNFQGPGIKAGQLLHVAIATREGEDLAAFRKRCADVPGFPLTLFDVMAPSPNAYFTPLADVLNSAHRGTGSIGDFCELIGQKPEAAMMKLGNSVAGVLGAQR